MSRRWRLEVLLFVSLLMMIVALEIGFWRELLFLGGLTLFVLVAKDKW